MKTHFENLIPSPHLVTFVTTRQTNLENMLSQSPFQAFTPIECEQIHSNTIVEVTETTDSKTPLKGADASFTCQKNTLLLIRTADCLPILIYHPSGYIAAIHAGRKSTEMDITQNCLKQLVNKVGTTQGFQIWFGPHIHHHNYQINPETNVHYNLKENSRTQIKHVIGDNFTFLELDHCTVDQNEMFYSYRKEKTAKRIYTAIALIS